MYLFILYLYILAIYINIINIMNKQVNEETFELFLNELFE